MHKFEVLVDFFGPVSSGTFTALIAFNTPSQRQTGKQFTASSYSVKPYTGSKRKQQAASINTFEEISSSQSKRNKP